MKKADVPVVKRSLSSWVFPGNLKLQLMLLLIIVVMVFAKVQKKELADEVFTLNYLPKVDELR